MKEKRQLISEFNSDFFLIKADLSYAAKEKITQSPKKQCKIDVNRWVKKILH